MLLKPYLAFILLITCIQLKAQDTVYYSTGQIKEIGQRNEKGEKTGEWKIYDENGFEYLTENYKIGELHGAYKRYFFLNQYEVGNFQDGQKTGEWKSYFNNGQLQQIENYTNGLKDGEFRTYFDNGQVNIIGNYLKGYLNGSHQIFFMNGNLAMHGNYTFNSKSGEWTSYSESGELTETVKYNSKHFAIVEIKNYYNGKLSQVEIYQYHKKNQNVFISSYYENGKLMEKGKCVYFYGTHDENAHCKRKGKWRSYYENGRKKEIGSYNWNNERKGIWKHFHENGRMGCIEMYDKNGNTLFDFTIFKEKTKNNK